MTPQPPNPQSTDTQDELRDDIISIMRNSELDIVDDADAIIHLLNSEVLKLLDRLEGQSVLETYRDRGGKRCAVIPRVALQEERKRYKQ